MSTLSPVPGLIPEVAASAPDFVRTRRDIHAHPELAFEESRTSDLVAEKLSALGVEVHRGLGGTGIVGTLRRGRSQRAIGLRAELDALPIDERGDIAHRSRYRGRSHGCGHDGHTAMLLAAAAYLAAHDSFDGSVHLIFQPAEETGRGAKAMMDDGLFERFPCDAVFALHNLPSLPAGRMATRPGSMLASADDFEVVVQGVGSHAGLPHTGVDPIVTAAHLILAYQSLISRQTNPCSAAVLSITHIRAGEATNAIPPVAALHGTIRALDASLRATLLRQAVAVASQVCAVFGARAKVSCSSRFPVLANTEPEVRAACAAARSIVGKDQIDNRHEPLLGSDDFAWMLERVPGCYMLIGSGTGDAGPSLHSPDYDFNDEVIPVGASYWIRLTEQYLACN